jgi:hypothetical protein
VCGACGSGRTAAPWEDLLAGAGPAERAARAGAAGQLLTGGRLRVTAWRGGYLLATATGAARPVALLDELWAAAGPPPAPPSSGTAGIGVLGPDPQTALADLLSFASRS